MNKLTQLLREQREEFEKKFICDGEPKPYPVKLKGSWKGIVTGDMIQEHISTAQQQLIDAIIEGLMEELIGTPGEKFLCSSTESAEAIIAYNNALQTQMNLLEEAKKNI